MGPRSVLRRYKSQLPNMITARKRVDTWLCPVLSIMVSAGLCLCDFVLRPRDAWSIDAILRTSAPCGVIDERMTPFMYVTKIGTSVELAVEVPSAGSFQFGIKVATTVLPFFIDPSQRRFAAIIC
jgi:hypothetical protein